MSESNAIGIGMIGCGTVGGGVAKLLLEQTDLYERRIGKRVELRSVMVRDCDTETASQIVPKSMVTCDAEAFFGTDMDIVIEVAGGAGPIAEFFKRALKEGKHVVTANKALLAKQGPELFAIAHENNASIAFEASCGGGIPFVTALQFGLMANRINVLYGILNGTCNYILSEMTQKGKTYAEALSEAQEKGFAEADPTMDVGGHDTAQKLVILGSLAFGARIEEEQIPCEGIDNLDLADIGFGQELGYDIKLLGIGERVGEDQFSLRVQPCFVHADSMVAQVSGSFNAISVYGHSVGHTMSYGRGAGREPTASAIVSDALNIASGWYPKAFADMKLWSDGHDPINLIDPDDLISRFYIRVNALDQPGVIAEVTKLLGDSGISLTAVIQHEINLGQFVPLAITTHDARQGDVIAALKKIEGLSTIEGSPVCIHIVEEPEG